MNTNEDEPDESGPVNSVDTNNWDFLKNFRPYSIWCELNDV